MSENKQGITLSVGEYNYNINTEMFKGYVEEGVGHLFKVDDANDKFKEVVETIAETTGMPKALVNKYIKAKHKEKIKEQSELAAIFEQLEEAVA